MKLSDVLNAKTGFEKILKKELPFKLAYRMNRLYDSIISEYKQFEKIRIDLCNKYGTENKESNNFDIKPENLAIFNSEFASLLDMEVKIDNYLIKQNEFVDRDGKEIEIDGESLRLIMPFIE